MDIDLGRFKRQFPFTVDVKPCPECGAWMERGYERDPRDQDHWRGVPAYSCPECGYAERAD